MNNALLDGFTPLPLPLQSVGDFIYSVAQPSKFGVLRRRLQNEVIKAPHAAEALKKMLDAVKVIAFDETTILLKSLGPPDFTNITEQRDRLVYCCKQLRDAIRSHLTCIS